MNWLNYHHLLYFWKVAKEGSIARACVELRLAPPTISVQIHQLEEMLGHKLFERQGRGLVLTEVGRVAFRYADSIFATGDALMEAMATGQQRRTLRLIVGVSDTLPRSLVQRFLAPVFAIEPSVHVTCHQNLQPQGFLAELAAGTIDVVLTDSPAPPTSPVSVFSHPLGDCAAGIFATAEWAEKLSDNFPGSLHEAPFLYPGLHSSLRRSLDEWCDALGISPRVVAELDDTALASALAEAGLGVLVTAEILEPFLLRQHQLHLIGRAPQLRQNFYAWSLEQKVRHPAVIALCHSARNCALT